jgi:mannose-1-phosphate guanylyltransferase
MGNKFMVGKNKLSSNLCAEILFPDGDVKLYGIILAAGNGKRMVEHIKQFYKTDCPKQYVDFTGGGSMIQQTLRRAEKLISKERLLVVANPKHQEIIEEQLNDLPERTVIYQPINRETAPGILLPLSYIYKRDLDSTVAIFPSDHFIREEDRFMEYIQFARKVSQQFPDKIVLLGIQPDSPEEEYGWIQPGERIPGYSGFDLSKVDRFHEKPDLLSAQNFFKQGYLWNTLVMVTRCSTLWDLAKVALPDIHDRFEKIIAAIGTAGEEKVILQEYEEMQEATISHDVLEKFPSRLLVINVKDVLWNDWGNGSRVMATLKKIGKAPNILDKVVKEDKLVLT